LSAPTSLSRLLLLLLQFGCNLQRASNATATATKAVIFTGVLEKWMKN